MHFSNGCTFSASTPTHQLLHRSCIMLLARQPATAQGHLNTFYVCIQPGAARPAPLPQVRAQNLSAPA